MIVLKDMLLSYSSIFVKIFFSAVGLFLLISLFNKARANNSRKKSEFKNVISLEDIEEYKTDTKEDMEDYVKSFTPISPEEEEIYIIRI